MTNLPATTGAPAAEPIASDRFPCTQSQHRFWILEQISPGNSSANVALCWELRGEFQAESIEAAFVQVTTRHEILRTRFVEEDGILFQEVVDHCDFKLSVVDLRNVPVEQLEARIAMISKAEACNPFDLTRAGLLRATLLQLSADRAYLLTTIHHMCFDGASIRVLGREIGEIVDARDTGRPPHLPDLALQYGDYALWQEAFLASADFEVERNFWRKQLAGAPYFEMPIDRPRGFERTHSGAIVSQLLPEIVSSRIDQCAKNAGVSVFALSCAVLFALLHERTGQTDISIGTQVASRDDIVLEDLIGVFINNIVLRLDVTPDASFSEICQRASATVRDALIHQRMPFNKLVEMINPPRDPARTPLISVNMIVQKAFMEDHCYKRFEILGRPSSTPGTLFDLNFMMIGRPEGWRVTVEYNPDLFDASTAQGLLTDWADAIDRFTAEPEIRICDLPVTTSRLRSEETSNSAAVFEEWLTSHPAVAAAQVSGGQSGERRILVTPRPCYDGPIEELPSELRSYLALKMPFAIIPATIHVVMRLAGTSSTPNAEGISDTGPNAAYSLRLKEFETEVEQLWRELLGLTEIDRNANFFDLGGHSLLAVRLVARLRERLKIDLKTAVLYQAPTIAGLALKLADCLPIQSATKDGVDNRINEINPNAPGIPIISINNYSTIYSIAKHFSSPRRCVSVRLVDPDGPFDKDDRSFEEIADAYVELVRAVQPQGPYAFFGVCVHGNLAMEVARRLLAAGEDVANVFVKDVWAPAYSTHVRDNKLISYLNKLHDARVRYRKWRRGELSAFDLLRYYPRIRSTRLFKTVETFAGERLSQETRHLSTTSQGAFIEYLSAARNRYLPQPYPGNVLMFRTSEAPSGKKFDRTLGWGSVVSGSLDIEEIEEIVVFQGLEIGTAPVAATIEAVLRSAEAAAL